MVATTRSKLLEERKPVSSHTRARGIGNTSSSASRSLQPKTRSRKGKGKTPSITVFVDSSTQTDPIPDQASTSPHAAENDGSSGSLLAADNASPSNDNHGYGSDTSNALPNGKRKAYIQRKLVTFSAEVPSTEDSEPTQRPSILPKHPILGSLDPGAKDFKTEDTMGERKYLKFIRERFPATLESKEVPPEYNTSGLIEGVLCEEPMYGLGWRLRSWELSDIMRAPPWEFEDWMWSKLDQTDFELRFDRSDFPELQCIRHYQALRPEEDAFFMISYNLHERRYRMVVDAYREKLIDALASILGFDEQKRNEVRWHRRTPYEFWQ